MEVKMEFNKDLIAASSTPIVLAILAEEDSYGYAILQRVRESSGGYMEWTDGMLYPVLRRLEKQGLLQSEWRVAETGKKRRYYRIKKSGRVALSEQRTQWQLTNRVLSRLWKETPCLT
jgi:DNA-binding PadR family transcriptional regulator